MQKEKAKKVLKVLCPIILILLTFDICFIVKDCGEKKVKEQSIIDNYENTLKEFLNMYSEDDVEHYYVSPDGVGIYIPFEKWSATSSKGRKEFCEEIETYVLYSAKNSGLWEVENRIVLTFYDTERNELRSYYLTGEE